MNRLNDKYPDTTQAHLIQMDQATDLKIWRYARDNQFTVVRKDSDFYELSLIHGAPPKIIWLECGNMSTDHIEKILIENISEITNFLNDSETSCLEVY